MGVAIEAMRGDDDVPDARVIGQLNRKRYGSARAEREKRDAADVS
jgi:hypothetical protein